MSGWSIQPGMNAFDLEETIKLGRANRRTLGSLPDAAFFDYMRRGWLLCARSAEGDFGGYLMYRVSRSRAIIVHLCVDRGFRKQGLARMLIDTLAERTSHLAGIEADSRRDFDVSRVWPRLGFAAVAERPGRAAGGSILDVWWLPSRSATLFDIALPETARRAPIHAALDYNLLIDLNAEPGSPSRSDESDILLADWLLPEMRFGVTPEVFNEIARLSDAAERALQRQWAHGYALLKHESAAFEVAHLKIQSIYGVPTGIAAKSDLLHLAHVVAAGWPLFITRDTHILSKAPEVRAEFGVMVISPAALLTQIDELENEGSFSPATLARTGVSAWRVPATEFEAMLDPLLLRGIGTSKPGLRESIRATLRRGDELWAISVGEIPSLLMVLRWATADTLWITSLMLPRHPLALTLARYALQFAQEAAAASGRSVTVLRTDLDGTGEQACEDAGYLRASNGSWLRIRLSACATPSEVASHLHRLIHAAEGLAADEIATFGPVLNALRAPLTTDDARRIEDALWPARILGQGISSFIAPIHAAWAEQLFDHELAARQLFTMDPRLLMSPENVYYRSAAATAGLSAGARLLWYVSDSPGRENAKAIRACSRILEVTVLPAPEAYRRFRRFGAYDRVQVLNAAGTRPRQDVMVIRFDHTTLLPNPVPFRELTELVRGLDGKGLTLQGPTRVAESVFQAIHKRGFGW